MIFNKSEGKIKLKKVLDVLRKREEFAVSLRKEKKSRIIKQKRILI